jgi:hypothetical protein
MSAAIIDAALAGGSLALFATAYLAARVATRPARVAPGQASPDLGDEPPAVVNLLANRWHLSEDAAESTVLDLAARGYLELRQPGDDPRHTTVHLRGEADQAGNPGEDALTAYERRVLDRIRTLAVDGVVPVTALTFRNAARARRWNRALHREVVADARRRGLTRKRFEAALVSALCAVAAVSAAGVTLAGVRLALRDDDSDLVGALWVGLFVFGMLCAFAASGAGERDTAAGRELAARWLGVRNWLRAHEEFANLPPAAVAVWDRYLSYGAALGVTHVASEVLDLGLADRRRVWSSYGGAWRRVRVRYPRFWPRYGARAAALLVRAGLALAVGGFLLYRFGLPEPALPGGLPRDPQEAFDMLAWAAGALAVLLVGYGAYVLARTLLDLMTTRTITGEVLWIQLWRSRSRGKNRGSVPWLDYLAVDDGHSDRTTAWGLPRGTAPQVRDRDIVRIRVRPWTRRVVDLVVVEAGRTHLLEDETASGAALGSAGATPTLGEMLERFTGAVASALGAPGQLAERLLTSDEVSETLGTPVLGPQRLVTPGPLASAGFVTADRGRQVLTVGVASGRIGEWVLERTSRGTPLPDVGDAAFIHRGSGAVRVGDATVVLALADNAGSGPETLPPLLRQAAARMPRQPEPVGEQAVGPAP